MKGKKIQLFKNMKGGAMPAPCPICKKDAECSRTEVGPWDQYVGLYTLECTHCGYKEEKKEHEGYSNQEVEPPVCPYCGKEH